MSTIEMDELRQCSAKQFAEIDRLKAELEKAQACAAEMRNALQNGPGEDHSQDPWCNCQWCHALSTSCGKGWMSPDSVAELQSRWDKSFKLNTTLDEKVKELEAENQLMREALESSANHWDGYAAHIAKQTLAKLKHD